MDMAKVRLSNGQEFEVDLAATPYLLEVDLINGVTLTAPKAFASSEEAVAYLNANRGSFPDAVMRYRIGEARKHVLQ